MIVVTDLQVGALYREEKGEKENHVEKRKEVEVEKRENHAKKRDPADAALVVADAALRQG